MPSSMFMLLDIWKTCFTFGIYLCIVHDDLCSWIQELESVLVVYHWTGHDAQNIYIDWMDNQDCNNQI